MIIENKELKTTGNKTKKRFINFGLKESFEDGIVTVIHQEQFNQLKKEYHELKENVENSIDNEELAKLEKQIQDLQEENQKLKEKVDSIESENESLKDKVAAKSDILEEIKQSNNERINDLKEDKENLKEEIGSYKSEVTDLNEKNTSLKLALNNIIHEYDKMKNRSIIGRIFNSETIEITEYQKLVENKPVYTAIDTNLEE